MEAELIPLREQNPPAVLKTPQGKEIKYIRPEEVRRLLSVIDSERNRLIVEVLWNTGARVSEVLGLTPTDVDFKSCTVTIRTLKKRKRGSRKEKEIRNEIRGLELALRQDPASKMLRRKLDDAKKRLKQLQKPEPSVAYRAVPIRAELSGRIAAYCMSFSIGNSDRLFPVTRIRVYQILKKAGQMAGVSPEICHPHAFRHGFAVNAVLAGVPPLVLRRWLGHASIDSTLIYTEVLAQDTRKYLERMEF